MFSLKGAYLTIWPLVDLSVKYFEVLKVFTTIINIHIWISGMEKKGQNQEFGTVLHGLLYYVPKV